MAFFQKLDCNSFISFENNALRCLFLLVLGIAVIFPRSGIAQETDKSFSATALKKLSVEELMDIQVTSVSRRPEKLTETASAIQVITGDDISNYGATNIAEALYLAGNLQVAQKGSHAWGITSRGFNTDLANKLLVLMDGRSIYTPLFSGVFWDRQDYLLEDINQIEVISGPGGTLWGANAVNGVINITTKSADQTQGLFIEGQKGNELKGLASARYGGKITPNIFYRIYGRYSNRDASVYSDSIDAHDSWWMGQGGFRIDAKAASNSRFTVQGDLYQNEAGALTGGSSKVTGGNILGRWSHTFSDSSTVRLQSYYDHTSLDMPTAAFIANGLELAPAGVVEDDLATYDIDFQHQFFAGKKNQIIWGLGYRFTHDQVSNSPGLGFFPTELKQNLFSAFIQDEITILKNLLFTLGTKVEHNDYTGYEFEPNVRLKYDITENWLVWSAFSRAVRTPSRIDRDLSQAIPPYFVLLAGSPDFISETVIAKEAGFRGKLSHKATTSISLYYNNYDHLRSTVANPETLFPLHFQNGLEGEVYGFEISLNYQVAAWWQLFTSYNLLREDLRIKDGETDINNTYNETADPGWQFSLRSSFDLPFRIRASAAFRWIDELSINDDGELKTVPSYAELDGQIAWEINDNIELSIAGRNLLHAYHVEYGAPGPTQQAIERSIYAKLMFRF